MRKKFGTGVGPMKDRNRATAKLRRGRGELAMKDANMTQAEWAQKHDPLFQIRGKLRHAMLHH